MIVLLPLIVMLRDRKVPHLHIAYVHTSVNMHVHNMKDALVAELLCENVNHTTVFACLAGLISVDCHWQLRSLLGGLSSRTFREREMGY